MSGEIEFLERTIVDGKVTVIETWVPATPGEYAPLVFIPVAMPRGLRGTQAMKLVRRRVENGPDLPLPPTPR